MNNNKPDVYEKGLLNTIEELCNSGKLQKKIKKVLIYIVIFNFLVFSVPIISTSWGKTHAGAKALTTAAATVNFIYIIPISKVFGYKNIFVLPFYPIRDFLYNTGISLYPKKDGERELMWFQVRYAEYNQLVHPLIQKMADARFEKDYNKEKLEMLLKWQDELTAHLESFSSWEISDKSLRKYRFNQFLDYAIAAGINRLMVVDEMLIKYSELGQQYLEPIYRSPNEMAKIEKVLTCYQNLRKYEEKYEPEGIAYLYNKTKNIYFEDALKILIGNEIIGYKLVNNKLKCDEPLVNMYGESYADMLKIAKSSTYYRRRLWYMGAYGSWEPPQETLACYCINSKPLKSFIDNYKKVCHNPLKEEKCPRNTFIGYRQNITRNENDLYIGY